jgi:DNA-binding response OmpR family regulator
VSVPSWSSIRSLGSGTSCGEAGEQERHQRSPVQEPSAEQLVGAILVVDDDPEIRDVVRWLLEDEGWTVETASDGRDALERATQVRPALIVLDMGLPILSGEEVAMRLRVYYHEPPPIVVVSADGRAGEKAARIGAAAYLHKPFDVDELARLVRRTLASH